MFIRKFGQEYHQICVTDSYQEVHDNYDKFDEHTGLHSAFAMESFGDAVTKIGSSNGTIIVEKTVLVTADLSVPANVSIDIRKGGSFAVSASMTLTILGAVNTNGQSFGSVFTGAGAVISNAKGVFNEIYSSRGFFPGGSAQAIHEESVTQNYEIGTRRVQDERVFRYCKAGGILKSMFGGLDAQDSTMVNTHAVEELAGSYNVTILDTGAAGSRPVDYYAGGYIWIMKYPHEPTGIGQFYRIKSSTLGNSASITLTLWEPLTYAIPASNWTETIKSLYCDLRPPIDKKASLMVLNLFPIQSGYYFWGQTWGPCFFQCGYNPGSKDNDREVYYDSAHFGILPGSEINFGTDVPIFQRIGFLINSNFVMLQLSP